MILPRLRAALVLSLLVILAGCGTDESEPVAASEVAVSEVAVYAPLPGQSAAVAYFLLENAGPAAITLERISSPEFASVEMHTTIIDNGAARMTPLDSVTITEFSMIEFRVGGHHLMLMGPQQDLEPGDTVTLEFYFEPEELVTLRAPLQAR